MPAPFVHDFTDSTFEMRDLLGSKGAGLAEMTHLLGTDLVPPGFTVTTEACSDWLAAGRAVPPEIDVEIESALHRLEAATGRKLGDRDRPLLLSVRSGGRISMPGMMDTVLNIGLTDATVDGLTTETGDERLAWDSFRRLIQMYTHVVWGVPAEHFEGEIESVKLQTGAADDHDLSVDALRELTSRFRLIHGEAAGHPFPQSPAVQVRNAISAVFASWHGERASAYRRINKIPDQWGTAATVQRMVFGNMSEASGSGVAFSRNDVSGAPAPTGDWLPNAQGEDVVSGSRNTLTLDDMQLTVPEAHERLLEILEILEHRFGDMQDCEFTVEDGHLWMLQTRTAKRPAQASVRFACDAVDEGLLDREAAILTIDSAALEALLHPHFARPMRDEEVLTRGVAASPGAASGEIAFSAKSAVELSAAGHDVILVRQRTEAADIAGFHAAQGILTSTGGKASHAALVARGMGRPCVCGASGLDVDSDAEELHLRGNGVVLHAGDRITLDGTSGLVSTAELPLTEPAPDERFTRVLEWADDMRTLGVRANADTPADARRASLLGAEGIGLCRTEHMFMGAERQPLMRAVVLARSGDQREDALAKLLPLQQKDFEEMLAAMQGRPVTIRLLDPPLHEFLRDPDDIRRELEDHGDSQSRGDGFATIDRSPDELRDELERTLELQEANPMLGTRGVRLGLLHPEIYEMQVAAIARALISTRSKGLNPGRVEIMVPLVAFENELKLCNELIESTASATGLVAGEDFAVGTMIELPRACVMADLLAKNADFFSFGTNDLTQTTLGFSRDDIEGEILERYIDLKIIDRSPFETIDTPGVGALVSMATDRGRAAHSKLELGVCGEHGGDPNSIAFFHGLGLDYVSCSPFRVPIARVAAAQAAIASTAGQSAQIEL